VKENSTPQGLEPVEELDLSTLPGRPRHLQQALRLNIRGRSVSLRRFHRPPTGLLRWLLILGPGLIASSPNDAGGIAPIVLPEPNSAMTV
jgi:hypothetical protein